MKPLKLERLVLVVQVSTTINYLLTECSMVQVDCFQSWRVNFIDFAAESSSALSSRRTLGSSSKPCAALRKRCTTQSAYRRMGDVKCVYWSIASVSNDDLSRRPVMTCITCSNFFKHVQTSCKSHCHTHAPSLYSLVFIG